MQARCCKTKSRSACDSRVAIAILQDKNRWSTRQKNKVQGKKIKYKAKNKVQGSKIWALYFIFLVLYFIFWDSRFCAKQPQKGFYYRNLHAKCLRYTCTLSILLLDLVQKQGNSRVLFKICCPKNKVQHPKIKYKAQNFEPCTLFFFRLLCILQPNTSKKSRCAVPGVNDNFTRNSGHAELLDALSCSCLIFTCWLMNMWRNLRGICFR